MRIVLLTIKLHAPFVHSLKDKRTQVKSLISKLRSKFNVSAVESEQQDVHQTIVLSIAALAGDTQQADSIMDHVLNFIEQNTQAHIADVLREYR